MDIGAIAGGFIAGLLGSFGTLWAHAHGHLKLEKTQRRYDKLNLTNELLASRYVLSDKYNATDSERRDFQRCIALTPFVFSDDPNVLKAFDEYFSYPNDTKKLIELIRRCATSTGIAEERLSTSYLSKTFTLGGGRVG